MNNPTIVAAEQKLASVLNEIETIVSRMRVHISDPGACAELANQLADRLIAFTWNAAWLYARKYLKNETLQG